MGFWIGLFGGMVYTGLLIAPVFAGTVSLAAMWLVQLFFKDTRNTETDFESARSPFAILPKRTSKIPVEASL